MTWKRRNFRGLGAVRSYALAATCALSVLGAMPLAEAADIKLRLGVGMEVSTLDPVYQTNNWELASGYNLYDSLVWPDAEKGVVPWVAESWQVSEDGKTYAFKIREGLKFHDGSPLTAEDVAFSMQRMLALNGPAASNFRGLNKDNVEAPDASTVVFRLDKPSSSFLKALVTFKIVNKKVILANLGDGPHGDMKDYGAEYLRSGDAGSGPYMLESYSQGELVRLKKFEGYTLTPWDQKAPAIVEFQITPEMATIGTKLRAGEIDVGDWSLPIPVQRQISSDQRFKMRQDAMQTAWYLIMNNSAAPLDDVWVRRAVASAHDEATLIKHITGAGGPMGGPVPDSMLGNCEPIAGYAFDLEKAREYLSKSKYSAEELRKRPLKIAAVAGSERFNNIALLTATNLKKIGLNAEVQAVRWADITAAQTKPETAFDLTVFYDPAKYPDPMLFLSYYRKAGWGDPYPPGGMYYENPKVTELLEMAQTSTDVAQQQASYCEAAKLITEDSPSVFSHTEVRSTTYWSYVEAFPDSGGAMFYDMRFEKWRLDDANPDFARNQK
ncbi:ABC transporter substrate-binding protein [Mesorhizobium sp. 1B3]|uniref:ABC transporter substrate-binding protein n=1 Tax=Mesorhizobium sp. 1B3 TaxID=3243599 RepID=UPI003D987DD4